MGMLQDVIGSVFPGSSTTPNRGLLQAADISFSLLILTLFGLLFLTKSVHVVALLVLSAALWVTLRWFAEELRKVNEANAPPPVAGMDLDEGEAREEPVVEVAGKPKTE